jgi:hypothetical protein
MDDFSDGPSDDDLERDVGNTHIDELAFAIVVFCNAKGWLPILMDGHTPGEQIIGVSTGDGLDMSVSISYTA